MPRAIKNSGPTPGRRLARPAAPAPPHPAPLPRLLWWLAAAYVFLLPVQFTAGSFNVAPSDLFAFAFLPLGIARLCFPRQAWSPWHVALLMIFALGTFLAGLRSGFLSEFVYLNKGFGILFLFLTYVMITTVVSDWSLARPLLRVFIYAVALNVAIGAGVLFLGPRIGFNPTWINYYYGRLSGMLIDPNAFGGLVVTALTIHACTYFGERPIIRGLPGLLCVVTLAGGLLLTLSRSAWIGFALALLFALPFRPRLLVAYLMVALAAAGLLLVTLSSSDRSQLLRLADRPDTAFQRVQQIEEALPLIREHPILGIGLGGFVDRHGWIIHDSALWMLTEFGMLGLAVFLGYIGWFVLRGVHLVRRTAGPDSDLVLGLACAHVGMFGVSVGIEAFYQRHWWMVMALLAAAPMSVGVRRVIRRTVWAQPAEVAR